MRRRAPPDVLRAYFQGLGEMHGHVLSALDRARGSFELQRSSGSGGGADGGAGRWEELPEAKQDRLLSAPFHDARVAARKYDEDDWGRAVVRPARSGLLQRPWRAKRPEEGEREKGKVLRFFGGGSFSSLFLSRPSATAADASPVAVFNRSLCLPARSALSLKSGERARRRPCAFVLVSFSLARFLSPSLHFLHYGVQRAFLPTRSSVQTAVACSSPCFFHREARFGDCAPRSFVCLVVSCSLLLLAYTRSLSASAARAWQGSSALRPQAAPEPPCALAAPPRRRAAAAAVTVFP